MEKVLDKKNLLWTDEMRYFVKQAYEKHRPNWEIVAVLFNKEYRSNNYPITTRALYQQMQRWLPKISIDYNKWSTGKYDLYPYINKQLNHYFRSGERLYKIEDLQSLSHLCKESVRKYTLEYLQNLLRSKDKGKLIYDMVFGIITKSYHKIKSQCKSSGFILLTTPKEWLEIIESFLGERDTYITSDLLNVRLQCKKGSHISSKSLESIRRKTMCVKCQHRSYLLKYKDAENLGLSRNLDLLLNHEEFEKALLKAHSKKRPSNRALLFWKHKKCGYKFERIYRSIQRGITVCPMCAPRFPNQMITHKICDHIFKEYHSGKNFRSEVHIIDILSHLDKDYPSLNKITIDIYQKLVINNRIIHLAVEYNGQQHDIREKIGFKAFKILTHGKGTKKEWLELLKRDKYKVDHFKSKNNDGYYLIVVPYVITPNQRQDFIIKEFEKQTGIILPQRPFLDWRFE